MAKRKLILLNKDGTVKFSKKSISKLLAQGPLYDAKWVLIPIVNTSATYVAVRVDTILSTSFSSVDIKFQLEMMSSTDDIIDPAAGLKYHQVFEYYPTTMTIDSWEELYNALYNVQAYRLIYEMGGHSDSRDGLWYMNVKMFELTIWKSRASPPIAQYSINPENITDLPFDYNMFEMIFDLERSQLGLYNGIDGWTGNIIMERDGAHTRWRESTEQIAITSTLQWVALYNRMSGSFCVMSGAEFNAALRIENTEMTIAPIQLANAGWNELKDLSPPLDELTVATRYELPTYEFFTDSDDWFTSGEEIYYYYNHAIPVIFPYSFYMYDDSVFALDHLYYFLKVYHEGMKALSAQLMFDDADLDHIDELEHWTTVFLEAVCHVSGPTPTDDTVLKLMTDAFQDHMPDLKEICYLLTIQEKPF